MAFFFSFLLQLVLVSVDNPFGGFMSGNEADVLDSGEPPLISQRGGICAEGVPDGKTGCRGHDKDGIQRGKCDKLATKTSEVKLKENESAVKLRGRSAEDMPCQICIQLGRRQGRDKK